MSSCRQLSSTSVLVVWMLSLQSSLTWLFGECCSCLAFVIFHMLSAFERSHCSNVVVAFSFFFFFVDLDVPSLSWSSFVVIRTVPLSECLRHLSFDIEVWTFSSLEPHVHSRSFVLSSECYRVIALPFWRCYCWQRHRISTKLNLISFQTSSLLTLLAFRLLYSEKINAGPERGWKNPQKRGEKAKETTRKGRQRDEEKRRKNQEERRRISKKEI